MNSEALLPWNETCPVYDLFSILGKKWTLNIIFLIGEDTNSFSLIMKKLPKINSKVLSDRLDHLTESGLILRNVSTNKPLKITYTLTDKGNKIYKDLVHISTWVIQDSLK